MEKAKSDEGCVGGTNEKEGNESSQKRLKKGTLNSPLFAFARVALSGN
jgi:hypothetical protein